MPARQPPSVVFDSVSAEASTANQPGPRSTTDRQAPLQAIPAALAGYPLALSDDGQQLTYTFDAQGENTGIDTLLRRLGEAGIDFKDLQTRQSSLEDIFVSLVEDRA